MNQKLVQLLKHLAGGWKLLGINQRISVALAGGVLLAGLVFLAVWANRTDYALLYGKLDDAEAAKVVSYLDGAKIPYQVSHGSIYVSADKVYVARMQLASRGIPQNGGVGFEIFDKPNFGISDFVQRANYLRAVQGELARTIGQLDQVETARVMIVMPENRLLTDNQKPPTASVFVKLKSLDTLGAAAVNSIRFLVANSVEGLKPNHVSVVDHRGNVLSADTDTDSESGIAASHIEMRRNLELYLAKKAESMLERVLGPGQAVVRVAAEVNLDTATRTEEKFDPDGSVPRITTQTDETTDSNNGGSGGVPGVSINGATETNVASAITTSLGKNTTKKKQTDTQYEINKTVNSTVQGTGNLTRVTAAVFVAARMEGSGAERKPAPRSKEELEKLRRIVQSALGLSASGDGAMKGDITLEEMPFNDQLGIELSQQLDSQQKMEFWWENGKSALWIGLALAALLLFWRGFNRTPVENIPLGVPLSRVGLSGKNGGGSNGNGNGNGSRGAPTDWPVPAEAPVVSIETINQLVRENPHNLTQSVRGWLNRNPSSSG
jgi:flagellar M-ring protein FliF